MFINKRGGPIRLINVYWSNPAQFKSIINPFNKIINAIFCVCRLNWIMDARLTILYIDTSLISTHTHIEKIKFLFL